MRSAPVLAGAAFALALAASALPSAAASVVPGRPLGAQSEIQTVDWHGWREHHWRGRYANYCVR
jgi:hypothetical protein